MLSKQPTGASAISSSAATSGPRPVVPIEAWKNAAELRLETNPDWFGYYPRAWALAQLVATTHTPFTAGIFAEWGRGKTTLLETVAFLVTQACQPAHWQKVWVLRYRPWLFRLETFEDVWLSIIEDIRTQVQDKADAWDKAARTAFLKASKTARLLRASSHVFGALGAADITGISQASSFLGSLVKELTEDGIPKATYTLFSENRKAVEVLFGKTLPEHKSRVLLLIDDLDRCHPDIAIEILRAIHVFARVPNLVCLLAMDRDPVITSLAARYRSREQANEYLHKIVQLAVTPRRISGLHSEKLIDAVLADAGDHHAPGKTQASRPSGPPQITLLAPDNWKLRSGPWRDFLLRSLCFNPRSFEKFKLVYDFRWSVLGAELPAGTIPDPLMTAAQTVIELRWPEWNWVAYRFPEAELRFKKLMRLRSQGNDLQTEQKDAEVLVREFSFLRPFLEDQSLCSFYQEYYRLRSQTGLPTVTSGSGFIRIRDRSIQRLASEHRFLEIASYLLSDSDLRPEDSPFLRAAFGVLIDRPEKKAGTAAGRPQSPRSLVTAALEDLPDHRPDGDPATEAGLVWGKILKVVTHTYRRGPVEPDRGVLSEFLAALSERALNETELLRLETHMSLQIESPASPSSQAVQRALAHGESLVQAIGKGFNAFWRENHGLASEELAMLLLKWRDQPLSAVKEELEDFASEGRKVPGFGSHEHKGAKDPRISVYIDLWKDLARSEEGSLLDRTANHLVVAFESVRQGKQSLPVNPDFYMALLHLACGIPPERIPLSFLLARMVGWAGSYIESQRSAGQRRVGLRA